MLRINTYIFALEASWLHTVLTCLLPVLTWSKTHTLCSHAYLQSLHISHCARMLTYNAYMLSSVACIFNSGTYMNTSDRYIWNLRCAHICYSLSMLTSNANMRMLKTHISHMMLACTHQHFTSSHLVLPVGALVHIFGAHRGCACSQLMLLCSYPMVSSYSARMLPFCAHICSVYARGRW